MDRMRIKVLLQLFQTRIITIMAAVRKEALLLGAMGKSCTPN